MGDIARDVESQFNAVGGYTNCHNYRYCKDTFCRMESEWLTYSEMEEGCEGWEYYIEGI